MNNPFTNIELKVWPDFLLAISGVLLVAAVVVMFAGNELALRLSLGFGGLVLFGIGGKAAHYKYRDPSIKGNSNAWFSGWRHSFLADIFAALGIVLVCSSVWLTYGYFVST